MEAQHSKQRVALFVDVLNIFYAAKHGRQSKVEYGQLMKKLVAGRELVRAVAYIVRRDDVDQTGFQEALRKFGYEIKVKDLKTYVGKVDGKPSSAKGSWDVGMAVDAVAMAAKLDTVVLVTGDGDFAPLVESLKHIGCRVEVAGFEGSTAQDLIKAADLYIPITEECTFKDRKFETEANAKVETKLEQCAAQNGFGTLGSTRNEEVVLEGLPMEEEERDSAVVTTGGTLM